MKAYSDLECVGLGTSTRVKHLPLRVDTGAPVCGAFLPAEHRLGRVTKPGKSA
jgi:hypothetical protein